MKNLLFITVALLYCTSQLTAQNNTFPYPNIGSLGIGIPQANFDVQIHGTTDYITDNVWHSATVADKYVNNVNKFIHQTTYNHGKTARFGLTNTVTGHLKTDGLLLRMSKLNAYITNQENKDLSIRSGSASVLLSGEDKRIWFSSRTLLPNTEHAYANIVSGDNGLFIRAGNTKYGLSIRPSVNTDVAVQVLNYTGTARNFLVLGNGHVYARKYTTTLDDLPDFVFQENYPLRTLSELRTFVKTYSHLPDIPSATEYKEQGVDLGEMNRLLLQKIEENVLYILQLEERIEALESSQKTINK